MHVFVQAKEAGRNCLTEMKNYFLKSGGCAKQVFGLPPKSPHPAWVSTALSLPRARNSRYGLLLAVKIGFVAASSAQKIFFPHE